MPNVIPFVRSRAPGLPVYALIALQYIGLREVPGDKHNPEIVTMHDACDAGGVDGDGELPDEVSWCSSFINWIMLLAGLQGTRNKAARSWLKWGKAVDIMDASPGNIIVFWRVSISDWRGHVAIFLGWTPHGNAIVLGANQGNAVSIKIYPAGQILGVRMAA